MSGRGKKKLAKSGFKISLYLFKEKLLFPKSQHGQGKTIIVMVIFLKFSPVCLRFFPMLL